MTFLKNVRLIHFFFVILIRKRIPVLYNLAIKGICTFFAIQLLLYTIVNYNTQELP